MCAFAAAPIQVDSVDALRSALEQVSGSATIELAAGTYTLESQLVLKAGTTLRGSGIDKTIVTHVNEWKPSTVLLPDSETTMKRLDPEAYLIRIADKASEVALSDMTLRGPHMHGAVFGISNQNLHLHHLKIHDTLWSGIRTLLMQKARIHDCQFIDAGGRWKKGGEPGNNGGTTGGAIFSAWMKDSEIYHNRFERTIDDKERNFYGVKVRQGKRCRVHHNTINVGFSIEFPFENDQDVEIDHNVCTGPISIPKHGGGPVPESGRTFHIHHNYLTNSYAVEFVRNGVEIDHNLFDFDVNQDHGNLISGFGKAGAEGPASFHNNLVSNPGRGVIWINPPYANFDIRNNHIITRMTTTPRTSGLFAFNEMSDFDTISIRDNVVQCQGIPRDLIRGESGYRMRIENNRLVQVSDRDRYENPSANRTVGLESPLQFDCGVHGEWTVNGWEAKAKSKQ